MKSRNKYQSVKIKELKEAFRKLLSYTYFDKSDLRLRHEVAVFAKSLDNSEKEKRVFGELVSIANGKRQDLLDSFLEKVVLCFYPKQTTSSIKQTDDHFITNIPIGHTITERLLVKSFFPVELMILDTAWLLKYGHVVDSKLKSNSYGNRLDLTLLKDKVRYGNSIFKKYNFQYQNWWENGLKEANKKLKEGHSVSIINFDITNCYHSINFDFDEFLAYYKNMCPESDIQDSPLTSIIIQMYEKYWSVVKDSDAHPFTGKNKGKRTMPLSLLSAHVLANWYMSPLDDYILKTYPNICYYGRYVDDCIIIVPSDSDKRDVIECMTEVLPGLIYKTEKDIVFGFSKDSVTPGIAHLSEFCMQKDKLYVYHFDCQLPQDAIEKYEEEQRERSSEFRFLTDEADQENGQGLEFVTLVKSFDVQEKKGRRFDVLEENKYKLSVFLAKLNQRLAKFGKEYEHIDEVTKVFNYFHRHLLIKHYMFWEKMFTAFVLSDRMDYVDEFYNRIEDEIEAVDVDDAVFAQNKIAGLDNIRETLRFHLKESRLMAVSLHKKDKNIDTKYLDTFMVRTYFNQFPLQEFTVDYVTYGVRIPMTKLQYKEQCFKYHWMPYYVKYYDIVCALMIGNEFDPKIYKSAYKIYKTLNHNVICKNKRKVFMHKGANEDEWEFNTSSSELPAPEKLTVSVVEMSLDEKLLGDTIDNYGDVDIKKINLMRSILDKITAVSTTNIFIMPELTLPLYELREFCQYSAKKKKAFIAGLEYVVNDNTVYNYIVTCLPIGQNDAVPVIRLKNYYAPKEYELIKEKKLKIPNSGKKWKLLYHWLGHVFASFSCFEITSIKDRAHFQSLIDAMYCLALNKDTPYFNNIAESCSRDLHCYFIMSNISQYGDSRVTKPSSSTTMNIMRIKGGNTEDNKAIVLSTQLNINELREFQKLSLNEQRKRDSKKFKIIPPNFEQLKVDQRKKRFLLSDENIVKPEN
jgi:hypothetical protein